MKKSITLAVRLILCLLLGFATPEAAHAKASSDVEKAEKKIEKAKEDVEKAKKAVNEEIERLKKIK